MITGRGSLETFSIDLGAAAPSVAVGRAAAGATSETQTRSRACCGARGAALSAAGRDWRVRDLLRADVEAREHRGAALRPQHLPLCLHRQLA